jgi:hypothetical protein
MSNIDAFEFLKKHGIKSRNEMYTVSLIELWMNEFLLSNENFVVPIKDVDSFERGKITGRIESSLENHFPLNEVVIPWAIKDEVVELFRKYNVHWKIVISDEEYVIIKLNYTEPNQRSL